MAEQHAHAAEHADHDHKPHGWRRWVYATNHKDIGTMYLVFACTMFFIGGAMAMVIRLELFKPGMQFVDPQLFNSMTTMHALIMIFGAVMPAWKGKLSETEIAAAVTYTKNAWSNHTGQVVQPADVLAAESK